MNHLYDLVTFKKQPTPDKRKGREKIHTAKDTYLLGSIKTHDA